MCSNHTISQQFFAEWVQDMRQKVDAMLENILPDENSTYPAEIAAAMRYSVLSGGKRLRPLLVLAACEACGGNVDNALMSAASLELIHTYSLIHDDLPCMDNDDLRRGKPSCHKKFGDAIALLAGDALLTLAFECAAQGDVPAIHARVVRELAAASGYAGMVGGQVADIICEYTHEKTAMTEEELSYIITHKTGKLFRVALIIGGLLAQANDEQMRALICFGEKYGFAFQLADDICDDEGAARILGKGSTIYKVRQLLDEACESVNALGKQSLALQAIAVHLGSTLPLEGDR